MVTDTADATDSVSATITRGELADLFVRVDAREITPGQAMELVR